MPRWRVRRLTRCSVLIAAQIPEISTAIAHLRKVLGDLAYESLAKHGETTDHRRDGDLRIRPNRPGTSRTERCLEIDDIRASQNSVSESP
jgi:hypothetical protein